MCKNYYILTLFLWCNICHLHAADTIRLNLQLVTATYSMDSLGKWEGTFSETQPLEFSDFVFSHNQTFSTGTIIMREDNFWNGFTPCTSGDNYDYGWFSTSNTWIQHQWGCMAGGGIDSLAQIQLGAPYMVAYWSEQEENSLSHPLSIGFTDGLTHQVLGIWICNHPWPYYGCTHGDSFGKSFCQNGEYFRLIVHGMDAHGAEVGTPIQVPLVEYRADTLYAPATWQWVDLTPLGQVDGVYFTMESTDSSPALGMNTAAFFCLGGIEMLSHITEVERPVGLVATGLSETTISLTWEEVEEAEYYRLYLGTELVDSISSASYVFSGLQAYTDYRLSVQAVSLTGDGSSWGSAVGKTLDTTPPSPPTNLCAVVDRFKVTLSWDASTDNVGVEKYEIYQDGVRQSRPKKTTYTLTGLAQNTTYTLAVAAMDQSGNVSKKTETTITTLGNPSALTDVDDISSSTPTPSVDPIARKVFYRGQICILINNEYYSILGQRIY